MGWSGGSEIFGTIIDAALIAIRIDPERREFYRKIIQPFLDHDWDTIYECVGEDEVFDNLLVEFKILEKEQLKDIKYESYTLLFDDGTYPSMSRCKTPDIHASQMFPKVVAEHYANIVRQRGGNAKVVEVPQ